MRFHPVRVILSVNIVIHPLRTFTHGSPSSIFCFFLAFLQVICCKSAEAGCTKTAVLHRRKFPGLPSCSSIFTDVFSRPAALFLFGHLSSRFPGSLLSSVLSVLDFCKFSPKKVLLWCIIPWFFGNSWYWSFHLMLSRYFVTVRRNNDTLLLFLAGRPLF